MRCFLQGAALLGLASVGWAGGPEGPALPDLLARAGEYAKRYEREFQDISADETYSQKLFEHRNMRLKQAREIRSDILFVRLGGDLRWMTFRDTSDVDGKPVRNREERLEKLFGKGASDPALDKAQQFLEESAKHNLGDIQRNFNLPTLVLVFLDPSNQERFKFKKKGKAAVEGVTGWEVEFEEKKSPAFIRAGDTDLFTKGKVWLDETDGRLLRSEMKVKDATGAYQVEIRVEFGPWREGAVWVPRQMKEMCTYTPQSADRMPGMREKGMSTINATDPGQYVETLATYSNYQAFRVETTGAVKGVAE
jgi:hypothetical protein